MPSSINPTQSISSFRKRAKSLLKGARRGETDSLDFLRHHHPKPKASKPNEWTLVEVQHALARSLDAQSWANLVSRGAEAPGVQEGGHFAWSYPQQWSSAQEELARRARRGLAQRSEPSRKARKRLDIELRWVESSGLSEHFIVADDLCRHMEAKGVLCGPGKGSDACSFLLYVLGVTHVNPLRHGLEFERLFSPYGCGFALNLDTSSKGYTFAREFLVATFSAGSVAESRAPFYEGVSASIPALAVLPGKHDNTGTGAGNDTTVLPREEFEAIESAGALTIYIAENPVLDYIQKHSGSQPAHCIFQTERVTFGSLHQILQSPQIQEVLRRNKGQLGYDLVDMGVLAEVGPTDLSEVADCIALSGFPWKLQGYTSHGRNGGGVPKCILPETQTTKGVLLYQEQVMEIASRLGRLRSQNRVRFLKSFQKPLSHNLRQQDRFIKRATEAIGKKETDGLVEFLKKDGWWFNKAHAVSYALLLCAVPDAQ